ncbi:TaqI-like C-terminal specificity domain-containing protein [Trueperella pecoris]|uniref:site-specific DNA-methyltransferase (adenine-specific) n=1 Tax=Trueperella pecoris TaxID=2733571 RepID=A0A7M1QSZ1_9ACTO|nr:TaqI-like C-terminal specificity domain-containing protein [Trueperella pecoris]QOR44976.1 N-6 DNA methylase [Trueperella pecoris]
MVQGTLPGLEFPQMSAATVRNWKRLGKQTDSTRLTRRANKQQSTKRFLPVEYLSNKRNASAVEEIAELILELGVPFIDAFASLGQNYLANLQDSSSEKQTALCKFLTEVSGNHKIIPQLSSVPLPTDEFDVLGLIYQTVLTEGTKNQLGSYYTPPSLVHETLLGIDVKDTDIVLDPSCGTLAFQLSIPNLKPENIYACDIDPVAVLIAKFNYFARFPYAPAPNISNTDFLNHTPWADKKFDIIATNPPWGAKQEIPNWLTKVAGKDTFAAFIVKSLSLLKEEGTACFLLPESFTKVKSYSGLRKHLLKEANLKCLSFHPRGFAGVLTKQVSVQIANSSYNGETIVKTPSATWVQSSSTFLSMPNFSYSAITPTDWQILQKTELNSGYTLSESEWALGIVTGNNKELISETPSEGLEPVITGKEIVPHQILETKKFLHFKPENFQQVAPERVYRAPSKLLYRFISTRPVFAVDTTKTISLNSANVLIPNIPGYTNYAICAVLNSDLYGFIYRLRFGDTKVLRSNLEQLIIPKLNQQTLDLLDELGRSASVGDNSAVEKIDEVLASNFGISSNELVRVREVCNGNA